MQAFRAKEKLEGFFQSSVHLDMPVFDTDELHDCIKELVTLDKDWMHTLKDPSKDQFYARMVHMSTDKTLGVRTP